LTLFSPLQRFLITWLLLLVSGSLTLRTLSFVGEILSILVTAGLIAFLLNYPVGKLTRWIPRGLAAGLVYGGAGLGVVIAGLTVVPPVLEQGRLLAANVPNLIDSARQQLEAFQLWSQEYNLPFDIPLIEQQVLNQLKEPAQAIASNGVGIVLGTFNWVIDLIFILVMSFYMLVDGDRVWRGITSIFSPDIRTRLTEALQRNLQWFVSGQLLLGLFMAVNLALAFWLLKVPFFLLFAVFIGFMEVIPFIGATIGISLVGVVVASLNLWLALQVIGVAIVIQQVKDNAVAPRVLGNLTGLSPVIIFAALLLGARVGGLLGVILAIPLTGVARSIFEIVLDPTLPPQTGSFFYNPLSKRAGLAPETGSEAVGELPEPSSLSR
jgi:predicted PurR-regulated permease PerM